MRYRSLDGDVGRGDDDGSADSGENLGADQDSIGWASSGKVYERDTARIWSDQAPEATRVGLTEF
jgi:hypothetical protein